MADDIDQRLRQRDSALPPRRRSRARWFFVVLLALSAAGAAGLLTLFLARAGSADVPAPYPLIGGPEANVSRDQGRQAEVAVAVDQKNKRRLLAASTDDELGVRIYDSHDGGETWRTTGEDLLFDGIRGCVAGDPGVAIGRNGMHYVSFLVQDPCIDGALGVVVVRRAGKSGAWLATPEPLARDDGGRHADDKPAIAVDNSPSSPFRNRVYVAWARETTTPSGFGGAIVITHSDDGGRTWSGAVPISPASQLAFSASISIARDGDVYVTWDDPGNQGIWIARSSDGERWGRDQLVAPYLQLATPGCAIIGSAVPAQPRRCVGPNPIAAVDSRPGRQRRVYVSYGNVEGNGSQAIYLARFDARLRPLEGSPEDPRPRRVGAADGGVPADQFWPALAFDSRRGILWVCYYDSRGDRQRRRVFQTCTLSKDDGRSWAEPRRVATTASDETQDGADEFEFGDYEGLAVADGVAHPMWTDSRHLASQAEEIYTTTVLESEFR